MIRSPPRTAGDPARRESADREITLNISTADESRTHRPFLFLAGIMQSNWFQSTLGHLVYDNLVLAPQRDYRPPVPRAGRGGQSRSCNAWTRSRCFSCGMGGARRNRAADLEPPSIRLFPRAMPTRRLICSPYPQAAGGRKTSFLQECFARKHTPSPGRSFKGKKYEGRGKKVFER